MAEMTPSEREIVRLIDLRLGEALNALAEAGVPSTALADRMMTSAGLVYDALLGPAGAAEVFRNAARSIEAGAFNAVRSPPVTN